MSSSSKIDVDNLSDAANSLASAIFEFQAFAPLSSGCSAVSALGNAGFSTACFTSYDNSITRKRVCSNKR